jgi:hypothetical protein
MSKSITITYNGEDYTLEFTRRTVREMEGAGFKITDIRSKPMSTYPKLVAGAFKCHHKKVDEATAFDKIYASITNKEAFIEKLIEMYGDTLNTLFEEPEESEKNAEWKANF